ncbi:MAG: NAD(P)H-hydrate dehydratase [Akkermansiaceae bacterium]|nr:NAD(P)H-hydrate dehydratase [Akkermansiaceae bacterium]
MDIHTSHTMRQAEQALFDSGACSSDELMESAIAEAVDQLITDPIFTDAATRFPRVIVYAGKGKNAGDAIGIARELGYSSICLRCACSIRHMAPETRLQLDKTRDVCQIELLEEAPAFPPQHGLLIIDGLLGSGAAGSLREPYAALVEEMNTLRDTHHRSLLLAVDIPTGLGCAADAGATVRADATLAIGCVKPEMLADGAEDYVGRLLCVPLPELTLPATDPQVAEPGMLPRLPRRPYSCYKNLAGRVRIIAGSPGYTGAAEMCAEAAVKAGAGLVELYCLPGIYSILASRLTAEVIVRPVSTYAEIPGSGADALLIGPGIGHPGPEDTAALRALVEGATCPLVLDADGLNLAAAEGWHLPPQAILTPHPGEMRRLFPESAGMSRLETAHAFVQRTPCTLLLKGARSIITNGSATYYNSTGGPHMANGGQGDVLAGVTASYAAQGMAPLEAALLGAYTCGRAADHSLAYYHFPSAVSATQLLYHLNPAD